MQTGVFGYLRPESAIWHAAGKARELGEEPLGTATPAATPAQGPARFHLAMPGRFSTEQ